MSDVTVTPRTVDGGDRWYDVMVPTERGTKCLVAVHREPWDVWVFRISGELFEQAPEAVTATIQMALLALRDVVHNQHGDAL